MELKDLGKKKKKDDTVLRKVLGLYLKQALPTRGHTGKDL
jgi:hypothetical protein